MLKLDEKDYNLNNILGLNFDMLKEILLKLSLNQNNISLEIKGIKDSNEERDKAITDLDNKIKELNDYINNKEKKFDAQYILKEEISIKNNKEDYNKEKENYNLEIIQNKEKKEIIQNKENKDNKDNKEKKDNDKERKNINNEYIEENFKEDFHKDESINIEAKINIRENKIQENEIIPNIELNSINYNNQNTDREIINNNEILNEENEKINPQKLTYYIEKDKDKDIDKKNSKHPIYKTSKDIIDLNSAVLQKSQMSYDIIRNILHSISEINEKINNLEGTLNKMNEDFFEKSKKLLNEHIMENKSNFNSINKKNDLFSSKIRDLQEKYDELEQKIIEIEKQFDNSKNKKPEIIQIFNDDKDNNEKIMSNTFKESFNKKLELNDNRYKKAAGDNFKLNQQIIVLKGITDKLTRQINLLKDENQNIKDNINLIKKETNEIIEKKNNELKNDIKEEMNKNLNDINNIIDTKIRELLDLLSDNNNNNNNNNTNINELIKDNIIDKNVLKADKALIKLLNKKVIEISEKIEAIEEGIKNQKKKSSIKQKELDDIKQCIVELYDNINSKIGKDDLKELYDFYLDHVNEIKYIRGKIVELNESQEKIRENTPNFIKRLESLTHDLSELQESDKKKVIMTSQKQVDLSNYITEKRLKKTLSPITEELEILISEKDYLNNMLNDISDKLKFLEKKEHVDHIEADINDKINVLTNRFSKQFIEKIEFNKIIKSIDIQIKLLQGNNHKKEEAENWLLAKQPIKCFNCATCEANIANSSPPNEYLPWNKIPHGEKQYRIGQGFSKLLRKLNKTKEDNIKSKLLDNSYENDISNKFVLNSVNNINDIMKINNRISFKEEKTPINIRKYQLPKVIENFRKKQKSNENIPITDDEKENEEVLIENKINKNSPKILKITKVKNENEQSDIVSKTINSRNKSGQILGNKLNRIKSVPVY